MRHTVRSSLANPMRRATKTKRSAAEGKQTSRALRVGDRVRFLYGGGEVEAEVVEDRGNIGVGGRQLVGIRLLETPGVPSEGFAGKRFEMPAEELAVVG